MSDYNSYIENLARMNQIVREMKEIPELPSEAPNDVSALLKVEFPETGGVFTYMEGHEFPYPGFPFGEFVDKIDVIKKICRGTLSGLYHRLKGTNKLWFLLLIPSAWIAATVLRTSLYSFYRLIERFRVKQRYYSPAVRELHRAFSVERVNESEQTKELRFMLRDLLCMILEYDNAYRFRMQDVLAEIDNEQMKKKPVRELIRLLEIMQSRELTQDINNTWVLVKLFVRIYLRFDKELRLILADCLSEIDAEAIELKVYDKWYCPGRKDYKFKFIKQLEDGTASKDDEWLLELFNLALKLREDLQRIRNENNAEIAEYAKTATTEEADARWRTLNQRLIDLSDEYEKKKITLKEKYNVSN